MSTFKYNQDFTSDFESNRPFHIDNYDSKSYDNIEKTLDDILNGNDEGVIKEYITRYIPEEERNITYNFRCSTNTIIKLNNKFILSQQNINAGADNGDDNELNKIKLEKLLFNSIKNYSGLIEDRNNKMRRRYLILNEKIIKNNIRRNAAAKQQQMFAFLNRLTYLGVISGVSIFCIKIVLIANLTNPATWIGLLSNIYANPLNFQLFVDTVSTLNIFTATEVITLKDMFSKLQLLIKETPLFQNKEYVSTLVECIFNPTPENKNILATLGSDEKFKDHEKYPQLMNFFKYIKSAIDMKNIFAEGNEPSKNKPIWEKKLLNELFTFYTSPLGNTALSSLKLATDAYGYLSQSADFFSKYKNADPTLFFKGIAINTTNSLSFNVYSKIFTQSIFTKIIGDKSDSLILAVPILGQVDLNTFFVTTIDSLLNVQIKSKIQGYFISLEKEAGYDPEKEKAEKEKEKENSIEAVKESIIKRGTHIQKYQKRGYTNEQIAKLLDRPKRPNEYKFILSRYMKDFYNTFLDIIDDPFVTVELFTNVSFVFNIVEKNFYNILMGGGLYYLPQMVLTGFAHKAFLDLGKLTGGLLPINIVPINVITAYFRYKYASDTVINREFDLLKYKIVNEIFSDVGTLLNEINALFFDTSLGLSINRYLESLNDTIIGRLFKISCKITYFFTSFSVVPVIKNKLINVLPSIKFPLIETLENKEKSERLFTFIDNKMSNVVHGFNLNSANKLDIEELIKLIAKDFSEFKDISKIIEGTIIPYVNAEGFFEWASKIKGPLNGAIIKFIKKPDDISVTEGVDEKKQAYSGDVLSEKKQKDSRVDSVKIILDTDETGYGDFKVIDTNDIKSALSNVYANDVKFDPRSKPAGFFTAVGEALQKFWDKKSYKDRLTQKGFSDEDIDILLKDKIKIHEIEEIMKEVDTQTQKTPTAEQIMAAIKLTDSLTFKTGNVINDYSMSNIYYYYYYKLFINEQLEIKRKEREKRKQEREQKELDDINKLASGSKVLFDAKNREVKTATIQTVEGAGLFTIKLSSGEIIPNVNKDLLQPTGNIRGLSKKQLHKVYKAEEEAEIKEDEKTLSEKDDVDDFASFLLKKFNVLEQDKRSNKPYNKIEHGILTDMITSLKNRNYNWFWDNKGDVIKSYLINDIGMKYLNEFFEGLHNPENEEYQIPTQILHKADLLKTEDYDAVFGVNLQHSYGFSPQIVDGKKFLNSIELLIALNSDTSDIQSLSSMISDLEKRSTTNINIQYSLDTLNTLYMNPVSSIIKYYESFTQYFKRIFCNVNDGGCNRENMVFFRHLNFNYSGFYDKMIQTLPSELLKEIKKFIKNEYIVEFLKNNIEIKQTCTINGNIIYLNNNFVNMNTGERMDGCVNNSKEINYKNEEEVLRMLLRPEIIFQLTKILNLPKNEYDSLKSSAQKSFKTGFGLIPGNKEKLKEYDEFFRLFNSLGEDGIKLTTQTTNTSIFDIICVVIDLQEKEYDAKTVKGEKIDPVDEYKLSLLIKFKKILRDLTKGYVDPTIKNSFIDYFTQKDDILDNENFLSENKKDIQTIFDDIKKKCGDPTNGEAKNLFIKLKDNYFDKDVVGTIILNDIILHKNDINFQGVKALDNKLNDYNNFEGDLKLKKDALKQLFEHNLQSKNLGELCSDKGIEFIQKYINNRNEWHDKQTEILKLFVLNNSNTIFSDLVTKYDKFKNDLKKIVADYSTNLSILWQNSRETTDIDLSSSPPSLPLTGMAEAVEREQRLDEITLQTGNEKTAAFTTNKELNTAATAEAKTYTQKTSEGQKQSQEQKNKEEEEQTQTQEQKNKEEQGIQQLYGGDPAPGVVTAMIGVAVRNVPNAVSTTSYTVPTINEEITDEVKVDNKFTTPSEECMRQSPNWYIAYNSNEKGSDKYVANTMGELTKEELKNYGCQTTNILYDTAANVNYFLLRINKIIIPILQLIQKIICGFLSPESDADASPAPSTAGDIASAFTNSPWCTLTKVFIKLAQYYSKCFIYIFHDVMIKKFSQDDVIDKLTSNKSNLGDKIVFSMWTQMINTLKGAESNSGIDDRDECNKAASMIGISDLDNLEKNAHTLINIIGSRLANNPNMNGNAIPAENNLPGHIDTGLREDGANIAGAIITFLNDDELTSYNKLMETITDKKPYINCDDLYPKFNKVTALKLSIYSLIKNPTNNFFYTNLKCRLFGTSKNIDLEKEGNTSILKILSTFFFTDWQELIGDFMVIICSNKGLRPFFLTRIFGDKSVGMKKNFLRDLIEDAFIKAEASYPNISEFQNYIRSQVSAAIHKFLHDILSTFWGKLFELESAHEGSWSGVNKQIYSDFRRCKSGFCSFEGITLVTKQAIMNVQNDLAEINPAYIFDNPSETDEFDLESEQNKRVIKAIVESKSYENFIERLKLDGFPPDEVEKIQSSSDLTNKWSKNIYQQYKEIFTYYKEYSEYNTSIIKALSSKFKTEQNLGFQYRLYNYNFEKNITEQAFSSFLQNFLIQPCPEGQILYFYTENDQPKFNCLDFADINIEEFDNTQSKNDVIFYREFNAYAKKNAENSLEILEVFDKSSGVICDNPEYCSDISTKDYNDFITQQNKEFNELLENENPNFKTINIFQKAFIENLKVKLVKLLGIYQDKEKTILKSIREKDNEIAVKKAELKDKTDENDIFQLNEAIKDTQEENRKLEIELEYFRNFIDKVQNPVFGLEKDIKDAELVGEILEYEIVTRNFIINELKNPDIDPEYFAFLYCKLFSISQDSADILTLYEFFSGDKQELNSLISKLTGKQYFILDSVVDSTIINNRLIEVGGKYRDAILKTLKNLLSKNQKHRYLYKGNIVEGEGGIEGGYYIKDGGKIKEVKTGYQAFEEQLDAIKPYDNRKEENEQNEKIILDAKRVKSELEKEINDAIANIKYDVESKELVEKYQEKAQKIEEIEQLLLQIRVKDLEYEEKFKISIKDWESKLADLEDKEGIAELNVKQSLDEYVNLVEKFDKEYYDENLKTYMAERDAKMKEYKEIVEYLHTYFEDLKEIAESDYSKERIETQERRDVLIEEINTTLNELDDSNMDSTKLYKLWLKLNKQIQTKKIYDDFLMKDPQQQAYDIRQKQYSYFYDPEYKIDHPKYKDDNGKPINIEKIREKRNKLIEDLWHPINIVEGFWKKLIASVGAILNSLAGYSKEDQKKQIEEAGKKVQKTYDDLTKIRNDKNRLSELLGKLDGGVTRNIENVLHEDKRGYIERYVYSFDEKLDENKIKGFYTKGYDNIPFTSEMNDLRQKLVDVRKKLEDIETEIKEGETKLTKQGKEALKKREELLGIVTGQEKIIAELEKDFEFNKAKRDYLYTQMVEVYMKQVDKDELKFFNNNFGYSIKASADGSISLQKTSNNFDDTNYGFNQAIESRLINFFTNPIRAKKQRKGPANAVGADKTLGKGKDGKYLPLNNNKKILDDQIIDGFPPIVYGSDIMDTVDLDESVNIYDNTIPLLERLSKQKIKQFMLDYYTKIEIEGGNPIWIMNTQIKLWYDTFEGFNLDEFSNSLKSSFEEKQENNKKNYDWAGIGDTFYHPTEKQIDAVFGVSFNYFDGLNIRGVENGHQEQQSIDTIRRNVDPKTGKMLEGDLLQLIPLNIYQHTLKNYAIDFGTIKNNDDTWEEYHPFELFFTERLERI
jgi:hypothetical protein